MEHNKENEAVYVAQEDSHVVMSEKVQALAGSIYSEFERMINKYDESVVKELMPLVVNVLECLDLSYTENQEHEVEVELLREDNEQLVTQYEREKQLRKNSEQKLLEVEDQTEEQIKDLGSKNESLEAILRMLELRAKNSSDHVNRLEDKENEMKKEYAKLHDRYTELFKTHMDYMERTKILMGTDRLENFGVTGMKKINLNNIMTRSAGPVSYGFTSLEQNPSMLNSIASPDEFPYNPTKLPSAANLQEEMSMEDAINESYNMPQNGEKDASSEETPSKSQNRKEERSGNTLYQEFSFQEPELGDENTDITGNWVHPGEYASSDFGSEPSCGSPDAKSPANVNDNFFGMGKEVENLILENNELLATKNALNIVKDDLIAKVDELSSEHEILREEIQSLQAVKSRMKLRIQELEEEVKKMKEELEKKASGKSDDEEDVPLAQRKRFTRVEMARVLMERNQYKERFMELQDAVRWTEMLRAAKHDPSLEKKNSRGIVSFFSSLFGKTTPPPVGLTTDRLVSSGGMLQGSPTKVPGGPVPASSSTSAAGPSSAKAEMSAEKLQLRRLGDPLQRKDQTAYKQIKAHVRKDDGRMQAYGWSLPAKPAGSQGAALLGTNYSKDTPTKGSGKSGNGSQGTGKHLPVPVPIYCRPFMEQSTGMKIFCASGVDLTGGRVSEGESDETYTSPHVWICTATHSASRVTIIDANRPADILQTFEVCSSHLLCISCVPGSKENDFAPQDGLDNLDLKPKGDEVEICGHLSHVKVEPVDEASTSEVPQTETKTEEKLSTGDGEGSNSSKDTSLIELTVTSGMPTMWLGAQSGFVMIHSAIGHWDTCLHKVRLPDSVLSITHLRGRTFVSMANGTVAIFLRGQDSQWDVTNYYLLDLENQPHHSIRCLSVVGEDIWCGFRNKVHVLDVYTLLVKKSFEAHPRKESQVRQMAWCGDGVWVSIRLDSTLRLYHAETHEHLQDVDIEPYVSKMLGTGKLGFSYARITALLVASHRLWVGTGNGVIISVPLQELAGFANPTGTSGSKGPGSALRVGSENETGKEIPYCSMSQAQLSFHGHRDAVKFFVAVPGASTALPLTNEMDVKSPDILPSSNSMLVISGGEGYIDFRVVDEAESDGDTATHLIVWKLPQSTDQQNSLLDYSVSSEPASPGLDGPSENDELEPSKTAPDPNHPAEKAHIIIWQVATKV